MLHSMTGFGQAEGIIQNRKLSLQIKTLNSKQTDIHVRIPGAFKSLEMDMRKLLASELGRGKMELNIQLESMGGQKEIEVDETQIISYFENINSVSTKLGLAPLNNLEMVSRLPEVIKQKEFLLASDDAQEVMTLLKTAIKNTLAFRAAEGESLQIDLLSHVTAIESLLEESLVYENERIEQVKKRMQQHLADSLNEVEINRDRFEQELVYYIEKFDISEEKVRLKSHCDYFKTSVEGKSGQGKKLGFIGQEMGREINTLGSKANHAAMQKKVVEMKDELEKIKEQVLNVL